MPLIVLKTLKNTSFNICFQKKHIFWQYSVFFVYCLMKTMKWAENHKKFNFSVKKNLFRDIAYIPFFWTKIKMVFLIKDINSPRNAGNGIIYAILREKNELPWKVIYFFLFPSFSFKTWKWKEKTMKNSIS